MDDVAINLLGFKQQPQLVHNTEQTLVIRTIVNRYYKRRYDEIMYRMSL